MSDNYLKLIPSKNNFIPNNSDQQDAISLLEELTPDGEEVGVETYPHLSFIDQGENLEEIFCPSCKATIKQDYSSENETDCSFVLDQINNQSLNSKIEDGCIKMPCCGNEVKTTQIEFNCPAGFSKFELYALNPDIPRPIIKQNIEALSQILGCKLIEIWARY